MFDLPVINGLALFASIIDALPDGISLFVWVPLFIVCILGIIKVVMNHD